MAETMQWIGDGLRVPEDGELVGRVVNFNGKRGKVVSNDAFTIIVEWEPWYRRLLRMASSIAKATLT